MVGGPSHLGKVYTHKVNGDVIIKNICLSDSTMWSSIYYITDDMINYKDRDYIVATVDHNTLEKINLIT